MHISMLDQVFKAPKIQEKQMERDRYLQGQLDLLQTKLKRLEQVISVGMPLAEAEETMDRLDSMEREIKINASKNAMVSSVMKEIKTNVEEVNKSMEEKSSQQQFGLLGKRVEFLEKLYGELSSSKTKDIFLNMVDIIQNLEARVKNLEDVSHRNISLLFGEELKKVKSTVQAETGEEQTEAGQAAKQMEEEPEKDSIGQKISNFFRNIFKRD